MQSQKWQNDLCSFPRQTIQSMVIQSYAPTSNTEEAEIEWYYDDLEDLLGEGNGNPLQYSCLENPMDRGAW